MAKVGGDAFLDYSSTQPLALYKRGISIAVRLAVVVVSRVDCCRSFVNPVTSFSFYCRQHWETGSRQLLGKLGR